MSKYIRWLVMTFRLTEKRTVPGLRMSQQMTSESLRPPLSSLVPSGENCRCVIPPLWPKRRHSSAPFGSEYTPDTKKKHYVLKPKCFIHINVCGSVDPQFMHMVFWWYFFSSTTFSKLYNLKGRWSYKTLVSTVHRI